MQWPSIRLPRRLSATGPGIGDTCAGSTSPEGLALGSTGPCRPPDEPSSPSPSEIFAMLATTGAPSDGGGPATCDGADGLVTLLDAGGVGPLPWRFGRFEILEKRGEGAFGIVYQAIDPNLRRPVALKVPKPERMGSAAVREGIVREGRAAARLRHENIVEVYEAGEVGGVPYIASHFCDGPTLLGWLKARSEPVPADLAATILAALADGVAHAHAHHVFHRDLKPSNVLLPPAANALGFVPCVADFGLAKVLDEQGEASETGALMGTTPYMAPELFSGPARRPGPAADVYALGVILYEVLVAKLPFRGDSPAETMHKVLTEEAAAPRTMRCGLPRDLETICLKCLDKDPARRYASAADLRDDLNRFLAREPILARPAGPVTRGVSAIRKRPTRSVTALAGLAGLAGCLFALESSRNQMADAAVRRLRDVPPSGATKDVAWLGANARHARPRLEALLATPGLPPHARINAVLALARVEPSDAAGALAREVAASAPEDLGPLADGLALLVGDHPDAGEVAVAALAGDLARPPPPGASEADRDALGRRRANAASALMRCGKAGLAWRSLDADAEPFARTHLVVRLGRAGIAPEAILKEARSRPDALRQALLLSLGDATGPPADPEEADRLAVELLRLYREDPAPGVHAAVRWVLDARWGRLKNLLAIDREFAAPEPRADRDWWVNNQGQTFAVIRGPVRVRMGSPANEEGRMPDIPGSVQLEPLGDREIPYSFAIALTETTVIDFRALDNDNLGLDWRTPRLDCPVSEITFDRAAFFCNAMSRRAGLPPDQWCYQQVKIKGELRAIPVADRLSRSGYRLPTEPEWEYACRAGAASSRPFGDVSMLDDYSWSVRNSRLRLSQVGRLKPNALGLFDVLGNISEWCDKGGDEWALHVVRGLGYYHGVEHHRSARRVVSPTTRLSQYIGLRIARTVTGPKPGG